MMEESDVIAAISNGRDRAAGHSTTITKLPLLSENYLLVVRRYSVGEIPNKHLQSKTPNLSGVEQLRKLSTNPSTHLADSTKT